MNKKLIIILNNKLGKKVMVNFYFKINRNFIFLFQNEISIQVIYFI